MGSSGQIQTPGIGILPIPGHVRSSLSGAPNGKTPARESSFLRRLRAKVPQRPLLPPVGRASPHPMSSDRSPATERPRVAKPLARPGSATGEVPLLFRIVGPHLHRAAAGGHVFTCAREATATEAGLSIRWLVFQNETLLKNDCRTLNDAKKLCRIAANEPRV
jgi:hypothetical protein